MPGEKLWLSNVYGVREAKAIHSRLIERARAGEEIIITKWGKPYARIIPLDHDPAERCDAPAGQV